MNTNTTHEKKRKILWIVPRLPWPPKCGASFANCSLIMMFSQMNWDIEILCIGVNANKKDLETAKESLNISKISILPFKFPLNISWFRLLFFSIFQLIEWKIPLTALPYRFGRIRSVVNNKIDKSDVNFVLWDGLHPMAAIDKSIVSKKIHQKIKHIYRAHNIERDLWNYYEKRVSLILRPLFKLQSQIMKHFESDCIRFADFIFFICESDAQRIRRSLGESMKFETVPVVCEVLFQTLNSREKRTNQKNHSNEKQKLRLIWIGGLDWWPNKEGILWFLTRVWPEIVSKRSDIHLDIIGRQTERLMAHAKNQTHVHGFLSNLRPLFMQADLMIVPIFSGSGVRIKALEGMSLGLPSLGTTIGLSGLPIEGGWILDQAEDWISLLSKIEKNECQLKGEMAKNVIQKVYNKDKVSQRIEEIISQSITWT